MSIAIIWQNYQRMNSMKKLFTLLCIGLLFTACSPEESSFTAIFSDMKITECAWKAHDGQQPDEKK